jgi:hypothetical protein
MTPTCPDHDLRTPCQGCRSDHLAEHRDPHPACTWCEPLPDTDPDAARAAARDLEDDDV